MAGIKRPPTVTQIPFGFRWLTPEHWVIVSISSNQAQAQVEGMCAVTPIDPKQPVRVPGSGALALREQQLRHGIHYSAAMMKQLQWCADNYQTPLPLGL